VILTEDEDGAVEAVERRRRAEAQLAELLAEDDIEHLAATTDPNRTAGALIVTVPRGRSRA